MTKKEKSDIKRKLNVINYAKKVGNINKACMIMRKKPSLILFKS